MKIVVAGATGFIGRALCGQLREGGDEVIALSRDPQRAGALLPGVPVADLGRLPALLPGVEAVVNLAGESLVGRWTEAMKQRFRESRIATTRRLVEAMAQTEPRPSVLVSASAVGYYGDRGEETLTESSAPGQDFPGQLCREWEAEAQRAEELGMRVVRLRFGVVLDPDGGPLAKMLIPFRCGAGGPLGSGRQWFPWIHLADAVGLIRFALETPAASGPINAVAPEPVRNAEFTRVLGKAVGRPTLLRAPAFALRLALGEFAGTLLGSQRVQSERAQALQYPYRFPTLVSAMGDLFGRE